MTNSSPQEPQNPIPERRRRAAAGVTFDEMIGIIVAFSTIGAILFWSLGGKNSKFASNFGLGKNENPLITGMGLAGKLADPNTAVQVGQLESTTEQQTIADNISQLEEANILAPDSSRLNVTTAIPQESYQLDRTTNLTPIAGIATLPGVTKQAERQPQFPEISSGKENSAQIETPNAPLVTESPEDTLGTTADDLQDSETPDTSDTTAGNTQDPDALDSSSDPSETAEMPNDVEPSYWAYPFVKQMSEQSLVPDFADDRNFEPDKLITRASMATLISQAFSMQPETQRIKKFKDVTNKNATAADVDKAVRIGFMEGYSDNEFRPLENIPRYQVLVTLASGLDLQPSQDAEQILQQFDDADNIPDWAKQQVAAAIEAGLAVNRPEFEPQALNPNEAATRAEVAAMIHQGLVKTGKLEPINSEYLLNP